MVLNRGNVFKEMREEENLGLYKREEGKAGSLPEGKEGNNLPSCQGKSEAEKGKKRKRGSSSSLRKKITGKNGLTSSRTAPCRGRIYYILMETFTLLRKKRFRKGEGPLSALSRSPIVRKVHCIGGERCCKQAH